MIDSREILLHADVPAVLDALKIEHKRKGDELVARCISGQHLDKTPSWSVHTEPGAENNGLHSCWSCVEENEEIWTPNGLVKISMLSVGDHVLQHDGSWGVVKQKWVSKGRSVSLNLDLCRNDGLVLTADHICMVVRRKNAFGSFPYLYDDKSRPKGKFRREAKFRKRDRRYSGEVVSAEEISAGDLREGDYMLFPVIPLESRISDEAVLDGREVIRQHSRNYRMNRVERLCCTERMAYLCGLYLAEGSVHRGVVTWTFNYKEKDTLALKVVEILRDELGLKSSLKVLDDRHTAKVCCCNTDLVALLKHYFGTLAWRKHLPPSCFSWPQNIQKSLIRG